MPAYKPSRAIHLYPAAYFRAFEAVVGGELGKRYETYIGEVPCGERRAVRQRVSSFKASMRAYPAHALHGLIPQTRTKLRFAPDGKGMDQVYLGVERYERVSKMLEGVMR